MPSILNSDDGVVSGTSGLKTTGGNDGLLNIQSNGSTVVAVTGSGISVTGTVSQTGVSTFAAGTVSAPSITFTGDTNTGIFSPAADTIAFTEGGAESMRIDSDGDVGIGTTSPSAKLNVATGSGTLTQNIVTIRGGGSSGSFSGLSVQSNSGDEIFTVNNLSYNVTMGTVAGNVGIGTSSPAATQSGLDISSGGLSLVLGANNGSNARTNSTLKATRIGSYHYTNAQAPFALMVGVSDGTDNSIQIGGGTSSFNAATYIAFNTAANATTTTGTERMRIDSSGNVGIGVTPNTTFLGGTFRALVVGNGAGYGSFIGQTTATAAGTSVAYLSGSTTGASGYKGLGSVGIEIDGTSTTNATGRIAFYTGSGGSQPERARITSAGRFLIGTTSYDDQIAGTGFGENGFAYHVVAGGTCLNINRQTNDGILINFQQDNVSEGNISVSGNTVSYNAFAGSHWSQLQEGRGYNPEILRGTVMSSIGEMCEWKSVTWTETIEHPAVPAVDAKDAVLDEEGNIIEPAIEAIEGKDAWTETFNKRGDYLGQLPVGATFTEDGVTKTVVDDGNERLPKVKISDVVGDKAVYGVFQTWDEVQDMLVTSLGAFVVRIAAGVTVQIGDLLESNGDGCAKVQDDDVIRSKTIGKVTSTTPSATYADGSYTVPAVLYCG